MQNGLKYSGDQESRPFQPFRTTCGKVIHSTVDEVAKIVVNKHLVDSPWYIDGPANNRYCFEVSIWVERVTS